MIRPMGARPIGSHGHYPAKFFSVPKGVAAAAREGLELRKQFGRGGTDVGMARARQLASGSPRVTLRDIVYIRSYLRRHIVDNLDERDPPSNGWIAWQLWGGWPAKRWVERLYASAQKKGWIARKNPPPSAGADAAFWQDVDAAIRAFRDDRRSKALLREHRFTAWDDGGCLALQQALMLFFHDALESDETLDAIVDVQPGYVMSPGMTEHALVWVERVGAEPLAIDSTGVKPGDTSARDWQKRRAANDREMMTVLYDELPKEWFERWRARIADEKLVAEVRIIFEEQFMKTQQQKDRTRSNPFTAKGLPKDGGREPYVMVRCVNGVINSKLERDGRRVATSEDVSSAHAICTSNLQRSGVFRANTRDLTEKGKRKTEELFRLESKHGIADQRLSEYERHLASAATRKNPHDRPAARKNPSGKVTELMRIAAPLLAGPDVDRREEAAVIVKAKGISELKELGTFWDPLVAARYNLVKMAGVVHSNMTGIDEGIRDPMLLLLTAVTYRARDAKASEAWAEDPQGGDGVPPPVEDPVSMTLYLADIDPLMACWTLFVTIREHAEPDPRNLLMPMLDKLIHWCKGIDRPRNRNGELVSTRVSLRSLRPESDPRGNSLNLWAWSMLDDCVKSNTFPARTLMTLYEGAIESSLIPPKRWSAMLAENVVSMPPFLTGELFQAVRQAKPPHITYDL